jgi:hypothetical protein
MILKELLAGIDWNEVRLSLLRNHPDAVESLEGFRQVFVEILSLYPRHTRMQLCLKEVFREGMDEEPCIEVFGKNGTLNKDLPDLHNLGNPGSDFADSETSFAIEMVPWEEWIGMDIDPATLKAHDGADIIAHCLLEMTFYGFDQNAIRKEKEEIERRAEDLRNMTKEERNQKLIPWKEVHEKLDRLIK